MSKDLDKLLDLLDDELRAEVEAAEPQRDDEFTADEFRQAIGYTQKGAYNMLTRAVERGTMKRRKLKNVFLYSKA